MSDEFDARKVKEKPSAYYSTLIEKHKGAARINVPIRRTDRHQKYLILHKKYSTDRFEI